MLFYNKLNALYLENSWPLKACKNNVNIANKKSYLSNRIGRKASRRVMHLDFAFDNLKIIMDQQRDFMFSALT
jgi:hypothetical protein